MASLKRVFVTGGNNGIGYETVKAFLQSDKPYHVLMGSRSPEKAMLAIETLHKECPDSTNIVEAVQLDLTSDESIEKAFEQVKASPGHIDALINNAGIFPSTWRPFAPNKLSGATFDIEFLGGRVSLRDSFTKSYDVNVAGPHVLTWRFMPLLLKSTDPRLIFVTGLSNITQAAEKYFPTPHQPAGWPKSIDFETIGYRCSKSALNMLMLDWNHKLKADGVKVWGVGPGLLATDLGGLREKAVAMGAKHASLGGVLLRSVVEGERDGDVGRIVNRDGITQW
jgi:NAD(P)-dependent dehydrogenase (short-subunit alcohol dehydrogenase family)